MKKCDCPTNNKVGNQGGGSVAGLVSYISYSVNPRSLGQAYYAGFYHAPAAHSALTQAAPAVTHGTANEAAGSRVFIVAGGPGVVDAGTVSIVLSGNSIDEAGARVVGDTETLVADITTLALNEYVQSNKKWLGMVTFTLTPAGGAAAYSIDVNFGHARFEDAGDRDFTLEELNVIGLANANDTDLDIEILHHKPTGWTYSAAAFIPGNGVIASLKTDYGTDNTLVNGEYFSWARKQINILIKGSLGEGVIVRISTAQNNSIDNANINLGVSFE